MSEYTEVASTGDLQDGEMQAIRVGEKEILLARIGNDFYAVANRCPHLGAGLAGGKLEGTAVTCPTHGSRFDIRDGRCLRWTKWRGLTLALVKLVRRPRPLTVYPVRVTGDTVAVKI